MDHLIEKRKPTTERFINKLFRSALDGFPSEKFRFFFLSFVFLFWLILTEIQGWTAEHETQGSKKGKTLRNDRDAEGHLLSCVTLEARFTLF